MCWKIAWEDHIILTIMIILQNNDESEYTIHKIIGQSIK